MTTRFEICVAALGLALLAASCDSPASKPGDGPACTRGATFTADDGCSKCFCGDDGVACSSASCSSDAGGMDAGAGCTDGGATYAPGQVFGAPDGCSTCFCGDDGAIVCSDASCADNNMCPPCVAPPSPDCVGSGPCGCGPYTCPDAGMDVGPDGGLVGGVECGATTCAPNELCMQLPGCPVGMEIDPVCVPIPDSCAAGSGCDCFPEDPCGGGCTTCTGIADGHIMCDCLCICASPDTMIATPDGDRPIVELKRGDLVYSVDNDAVTIVPLERVGRQRVQAHEVMRVELENGTVLEISPGHPTADGRLFADLEPGGVLDGQRVIHAGLIDYRHEYTHDILPASSTGAYFAGGVLIGSTLNLSPRVAAQACR